MKKLNFVDPEQVVSKQEFLAALRAISLAPLGYVSGYRLKLEDIEWLDSITNDIVLSPVEADLISKLLETIGYHGGYSFKLLLLFNEVFFPDVQDVSKILLPADDTGILKRFFRVDLLDDERKKYIPSLFKKIGDKEMFYLEVRFIIDKIRVYCAQNAEFAEAYQAKLAEIRNINGHLKERLAFYIEMKAHNDIDDDLIRELEQPAFEMLREWFITDTTFDDLPPLLKLSFISLLQTHDEQTPHWDEKNELCRMLLDHAIFKDDILFLDKQLFQDYTIADVVLIICNRLKWWNDNMPQLPKSDFIKNRTNYCKEYAQFMEVQLSEFFSDDLLQKYSDILHDRFFLKYSDILGAPALRECSYMLEHHFLELGGIGIPKLDLLYKLCNKQFSFLCHYITRKIALAIIENNHEQFLEISRLFDNENEDWKEFHLESLQYNIFSMKKFSKNDDLTKGLRNILKTPFLFNFFLKSLLASLKESWNDTYPLLSLEDFIQKYIPLEIFPEFLIYSYPSDLFSREIIWDSEDALTRLLPCFTALAIKNTDEMLSLLDRFDPWKQKWGQKRIPIELSSLSPIEQLFLCVLDRLCEQHEKGHEAIALIFEIIFRKLYAVPVMIDIIKKYPQVQQLVFEHCSTILKESWDTPIYTPLSSHQINADIPARIIGMHKGPWHGLKPLLIALRKTRKEWVDASLNINHDCCLNGSNIVSEIDSYLNFDLSRKLLQSLRQDMANGLIDWLKPLPESKRSNLEKRLTEFSEIEQNREGFDITYTEPDPIWRYAYVRTIADLGVDVDGKGHYIHSVMDKVAKQDPSEMVRIAAEKASAKLKKLRDGWDRNKDAQKIVLALWWLKQASRLALNLPIERESSLYTRKRELESCQFENSEEDMEEERKLDKKLEEEKKEREKLLRARFRI